ncbi:MAG TPA: hypothetical protein VGG27_14000 [Magnetospirillaceae bacterium]|jgi:flagellar basal body-associated protein FliL
MKRIIIIVVLIALLGGGAAAASIFLHVGPLANLMKPKAPPAPPAPPPPPAHDEAAVGSFIIPVVQDHGINRSLGLDIALDVMKADRSKIEAKMPLIVNAFTLTLFELVPNHSDAHSAADKKLIHDRLMMAADKTVGKGLIQDVVIKAIYDR